MFQLTPVARNLLIINVAVFAFGNLLSIDLSKLFGLRFPGSSQFASYQIITHMFVHAGIGHIFSNMLALIVFGPALETYWGSLRFLAFYFICGLGASACYLAVESVQLYQLKSAVEAYLQNPSFIAFDALIAQYGNATHAAITSFLNHFGDNPENPHLIAMSKQLALNLYEQKVNIPMVGASGAIFGILMAFGMMFPNIELMLLFPPIPIKAKYFVLLYGVYEIYSVIQAAPSDNIAHFAHLGGMLFAFVLVRYWQKRGEI
ncbi:MAG: rhomboid family intramembrane serine protease [Cytophagales bacterium]|nr:rhomboid family intramembrane serine protease [Bernardetiaceae bacterium]MDW8209616.1 rhomboid family intramembrane serine protease [Cytophagales bacterium]